MVSRDSFVGDQLADRWVLVSYLPKVRDYRLEIELRVSQLQENAICARPFARLSTSFRTIASSARLLGISASSNSRLPRRRADSVRENKRISLSSPQRI